MREKQHIEIVKKSKILHPNFTYLFFCIKVLTSPIFLCYDENMEIKYYKHKIENLLTVNKIVMIQYHEFDKGFVSHSEAHNFWEMVYLDKGSLLCYRDGEEVPLSEGEVLFHKPGVTHLLKADGKRAPNVFVLCFEAKGEAVNYFENRRLLLDERLCKLVFQIIEESKKTFDLPYSDPELKKMKLLTSPALGGMQVIKNYLEILLIQLMRDGSDDGSQDVIFLRHGEADEKIVEGIAAYMREHVEERLSMEDICAIFHYHPSYIFRRFKESVGCSVMAYFMRLKIDKAKQLLRETSLSIGEIAVLLSFDNANYFSKAFKKVVGYTPFTYRKIRRKAK